MRLCSIYKCAVYSKELKNKLGLSDMIDVELLNDSDIETLNIFNIGQHKAPIIELCDSLLNFKKDGSIIKSYCNKEISCVVNIHFSDKYDKKFTFCEIIINDIKTTTKIISYTISRSASGSLKDMNNYRYLDDLIKYTFDHILHK